MAAFIITCPNCHHQFEPTDALREEVEEQVKKEANIKAKEWQERKEKEFREKELQWQQQSTAKEEAVKKSVHADFENQIKLLQQTIVDNDAKLKEARNKELEFLQKERNLKVKEEELQLTVQKQLLTEREKLKEQLVKEEAERLSVKEQEHHLQIRELQKQLEDQKKLTEEMKRKQEQGSMQLQGEVQELLLEEILRNTFPFDKIEEVAKGIRGADCVQTVRNQFGNEAGIIIYESKRTKDFSAEWIEKLKTDMRTLSADIAVIVTQALPKDMERFGEKEGVYICTFAEVRSVAMILRNAVLKVFEAKKSQENKGDKMILLYDYLTNNEFGEQWKAIREGFMAMKLSIQKERDAMEKLWKAREKQLDKVLLNAAHIKGSIEGIAGTDINLNLLEDGDSLLLE
jgi:hypothetical protein